MGDNDKSDQQETVKNALPKNKHKGPLFAGIGHVSLKDSHERPPGRFSHKGSISKRATVLYGRGFPAMGLTTGRTRPTEATPSPRTQTVRKGGMQVQNRAQTRIFSCTLVKLLRVMTYEHKFKFFVIKKNIYLRRTIRGYFLFGKVSPLPASMFNFPYIFCERFGVHDLFLHLLSPRKLHFHLFLSFNCTPFSISFIV